MSGERVGVEEMKKKHVERLTITVCFNFFLAVIGFLMFVLVEDKFIFFVSQFVILGILVTAGIAYWLNREERAREEKDEALARKKMEQEIDMDLLQKLMAEREGKPIIVEEKKEPWYRYALRGAGWVLGGVLSWFIGA